MVASCCCLLWNTSSGLRKNLEKSRISIESGVLYDKKMFRGRKAGLRGPSILGFFNKCTFKVCVSCSWRFPGTFAPSPSHLMVSLCIRSSRCNAQGESTALEGRHVSSKSPSSSEMETRESLVGIKIKAIFLTTSLAPLMFDCLQHLWIRYCLQRLFVENSFVSRRTTAAL